MTVVRTVFDELGYHRMAVFDKESQMFKIDHQKSFPALRNAPIVEAVIQIFGTPTKRVHDGMKDQIVRRFPNYQVAQTQRLSAEFEMSASATVDVQQSWEAFRLVSADGKYVAQLGPDSVAVSRLAPYENWSNLLIEAERFWSVFFELAAPNAIERIGVRYISQVELRDDESANDYIDDAPVSLSVLGMEAETFFHKDTFPIVGHPFKVDLGRVVRVQEPPLPRRILIVDIDVMTTGQMPLDHWKSRLPDMRFIKNEVFFAFMKNATTKFC